MNCKYRFYNSETLQILGVQNNGYIVLGGASRKYPHRYDLKNDLKNWKIQSLSALPLCSVHVMGFSYWDLVIGQIECLTC